MNSLVRLRPLSAAKGAVVFVESNTTGTGAAMARTARRLGYYTVLLAGDASRYAFARSVDEVQRIDANDEAAVVAACEALRRRTRLAAVATTSDRHLATAAVVSAHLGLVGEDPDALRRCADKGRQRDVLAAAGVPVPAYGVSRGVREGEVSGAVAAAGDGPFVVKPVVGSGSVGVRWCATAAEAMSAVRQTLATGVNERGAARPSGAVVESYVEGPEVSVEVVAGRVVGVTGKRLGPLPRFVEIGHDFPSGVSHGDERAAAQVALDAIAALGLAAHAAHVEVRLPPGEPPVIVEVNPRLGGGGIVDVVRFATGRDLVAEYLSILLGAATIPSGHLLRSVALRSVTAEALPGGVLERAPDLAAVKSVPGVVDVTMCVVPGACVGGHGDFRDRVARVVALGATADPDSAARAADRAAGVLRDAVRAAMLAPVPT